jgi:hypothetical protein
LITLDIFHIFSATCIELEELNSTTTGYRHYISSIILYSFIYSYIFITSVTHDSSPNIVWVIKSRRMSWAGHIARMGDERGVYRVLVGKPEGKRQLGRPRRRWEDNIRMDLQEVGCGDMDWIGLTHDEDRWLALVNAVMNL